MILQTLINTDSSTDSIPVKRTKQAGVRITEMITTLTAHVHTWSHLKVFGSYFIQLIHEGYISIVRRLHSIGDTNYLHEIKQPTGNGCQSFAFSRPFIQPLCYYILTSFMSLYRFIFMKVSASLSNTTIILSTLYLSFYFCPFNQFIKCLGSPLPGVKLF